MGGERCILHRSFPISRGSGGGALPSSPFLHHHALTKEYLSPPFAPAEHRLPRQARGPGRRDPGKGRRGKPGGGGSHHALRSRRPVPPAIPHPLFLESTLPQDLLRAKEDGGTGGAAPQRVLCSRSAHLTSPPHWQSPRRGRRGEGPAGPRRGEPGFPDRDGPGTPRTREFDRCRSQPWEERA